MRGYHKDEELTRRVLSPDGWFDTGDLGYLTEEGDLVFRGRAKETIVLSGGENVEPSRVEEAILSSPLVEQAIVVGQDRKTLAALVLPNPEGVAKALGTPADAARADLAKREDVRERLRKECVERTSRLKPEEKVARITLLSEPLDTANGMLTQTL
jgi:long-chain acyl-CoA synthetase